MIEISELMLDYKSKIINFCTFLRCVRLISYESNYVCNLGEPITIIVHKDEDIVSKKTTK